MALMSALTQHTTIPLHTRIWQRIKHAICGPYADVQFA